LSSGPNSDDESSESDRNSAVITPDGVGKIKIKSLDSSMDLGDEVAQFGKI